MVAEDYQRGLLERLNDEVKDTPWQDQSVITTIKELAPKRERVVAFNYASEALNNSFFLDMLKPPGTTSEGAVQSHEHSIFRLADPITTSFGSLAGMKSAFSAAAMGMFGSGYVWLVHDYKMNLSVAATYGAGTMLIRSRRHLGPREWTLGATQPSPPPPTIQPSKADTTTRLPTLYPPPYHRPSPTSGAQYNQPLSPYRIKPNRSFSSTLSLSSSHFAKYATESLLVNPNTTVEKSSAAPQFGERLAPLFACSIHEHCWIRDHGVWGKEAYLRNFWDVLDWRKVETIWAEYSIEMRQGQYGA